MAKKSDSSKYLASAPASALDSGGADRLPYIPGAILEKAAAEPETLERWLCRAVSASSLDEVLDEG